MTQPQQSTCTKYNVNLDTYKTATTVIYKEITLTCDNLAQQIC